ncbi:hypothetical protein SprV_0200743400 [Sparganum proliferum]
MLIRTNATDEAKHTVRQKVTSLLLTNRPTNNMSPAEIEATKELKMDKDIIVLPADKGRPTVVMNRVDYNEKAQALLDDQQSYKSTSSSRAQSMIGQLTGLLNRLKRNSAISLDEWRQMKPTDTALARFYGLPKIQKPNVPLRPIVALKAVLLTIYPSGWPENDLGFAYSLPSVIDLCRSRLLAASRQHLYSEPYLTQRPSEGTIPATYINRPTKYVP